MQLWLELPNVNTEKAQHRLENWTSVMNWIMSGWIKTKNIQVYLLITMMAFKSHQHGHSAEPDSLILCGYKGKHLRGIKTDE